MNLFSTPSLVPDAWVMSVTVRGEGMKQATWGSSCSPKGEGESEDQSPLVEGEILSLRPVKETEGYFEAWEYLDVISYPY